MENELPSVLYKYVTAEAAESILNSQSVRYSSATATNDILDISWNLGCDVEVAKAQIYQTRQFSIPPDVPKSNFVLTESEAKELASTIPNGDEIIELLARVQTIYWHRFNFDNVGILSLTKNPYSPVLWGHYARNSAQSYGGYCLGFRSDSKAIIGETFERLKGPLPINYEVTKPLIDGLTRTQQIEKVFLTKNKEWGYEQEFRSFALLNKGTFFKDKLFDTNDLVEIHIGFRAIGQESFELCESAMKRFPRVKIFASYPSVDTYQMESFEISKSELWQLFARVNGRTTKNL